MSDLGPAQLAKRLGIGLKALRLWEAEGLIAPHRLANGWRVFSDSDVANTWRVAALKRLGFSLKAIKALLHRDTPSFEIILEAQAKGLAQQAKAIDRAANAVAAARRKLSDGKQLDVDTLIHLHTEIIMSNAFKSDAIEKLWQQTYTPEQIAALKARPFSDEDAKAAGEVWSELIAQADRLAVIGNHKSPEALDLARRWMQEVDKFTQGDPGMERSSYQFYHQGFSDPKTKDHMQFSQEVWDFVGRSVSVLRERAEPH
jgi:MerR family transcriptional regulator, thiopeptide resistance regulator